MAKKFKKKSPDYDAYIVTKDVPPQWLPVGRAWAHGDGQGLNVQIFSAIVAGTVLVLRDVREQGDDK